MLWETGGASGGVNGLGGFSARAGYTNGIVGSGNVTLELTGSAVNGALLNGGANALVTNSLNNPVAGRYLFAVRGGTPGPPAAPPVTPATGAPATTTPVLIFSGVMLIGIVSYMKARAV